MRFPLFTSALAAVCFALPSAAQHGGDVQVFGGPSMRACSSVILFGSNMMAGITVTHGQPVWQDEYTAMLDKLKGKTNRLGKDLWTTFMTSVPVEIGGQTVPAGSYVVGLNCDKEGKFALAMMDATKAMKEGKMPFTPWQGTPELLAPMTLNKNVAEESVKQMLITLKTDDDNPMLGTFTIAWGPHTLTAPMKIVAGK